MTIQNYITLMGLMDGTSINLVKRVANLPLVQRYNKGTTQYVPDFEALAENARPVVVVIPRDAMSGDVYVPTAVTYKYNGVELAFGADGLSTNETMAGVFKKLADYPTPVGGETYNLPALRVMKNLVPLSGYDNDLITVSGTVEIGGQSVAFEEAAFPVTIQESSGAAYDILVYNNEGSQITAPGDTVTMRFILTKGGVPVTDLSGYAIQWFKVTATGNVNLGTAATQAVTAADVDGNTMFGCSISQNGTLLVTGYDEVTDASDPYYVSIKKTGINGNTIKAGQTAVITPVAVNRRTGEEVTDAFTSWTFRTTDNAGAAFTLTGKDSDTFTGASASVTYSDVKRAKMGLNIYMQSTN